MEHYRGNDPQMEAGFGVFGTANRHQNAKKCLRYKSLILFTA
jgi:hypothetical protein